MVLLLLTDGSLLEVPHVAYVAHKPGALVCFDPNKAPVASFDTSKVLGYTLNQRVAEGMKEGDPGLSSDDNPSQSKLPSSRLAA